jgi:hypothetical protein
MVTGVRYIPIIKVSSIFLHEGFQYDTSKVV